MKRLKLFLLLLAFIAAPLAMMAQNVIYTNDFESGSGLPSGWVAISGTASISTTNPHGTGHSFKFDQGTDIVVAMQSFNVDVSSLILTVWERPESATASNSGDFEIGYVTSVSNASSFVSLLSVNAADHGTTYVQQTVDYATANVPSGARIAFRQHNCSSNWYWFIDDLSVAETLPCNGPTGLYVSDLTTTSATLNWGLTNGGSDNPATLSLVVTDEDGNTIVSNNAVPGTDINFMLTGLTPNTTYSVSMRGDCSSVLSGYSSYATFTFTTMCNPGAVPYTEDFDALAGLPDCVYALNAAIDASTKYGTAGKSLKLSTTVGDNAYMIFPSLNHAANDIEMGFWAKSNVSTPLSYMVGVVSDLADIEGSFEPLYIDSLASAAGWTEVRMNTSLASSTTSPVMMCVFVGGGKSASFNIDNVAIHAIPSCVRPEQFRAFNPTSSSVDLTWSTSNAANHIVEYMGPDSVWMTAVAATNPYTLSGLQPNTQYSFRLRALCAPGDTSEYASAVATAKTLCVPMTTATWAESAELTAGNALPDCWTYGWFNRPTSGTSYDQPFQTQSSNAHSGSRSFQLRDMTSGAVSYLTSPGFTIDQPNVYQATIWVYRPSGTNSAGEGLHLFASNSPDDITGAQDLGFINRCAGNAPVEVLEAGTYGGWFKYSFPIAKTGVVYLIIQGESKYGSSTNFDDVSVELAPTCLTPSNVTLGEPTVTDNTLTWTPSASGETSWVIAYDLKVGNTVVAFDSLVVNSPSYTFSNLAAATNYTVKARIYSVCSETEMSEAKVFNGAFATPCGVINVFPYLVDFESFEANAIPLCWDNSASTSTSVTSNPHYLWGVYSFGGNKMLRMYNYYASNGTALINTPTIVLPAEPAELQFDYSHTANCGNMDVKISTDSGATFVNLNTYSKTSTGTDYADPGTFTHSTVDLTAYAGQTVILQFFATANYGSGAIFLDNVLVRRIPDCKDLPTPVISDVQPSSAIVSIADTASAWDICYGPQGTAAGAGTVITVNDTNAYTLTGLTANTTYDVYVRRNCGTEYGAWTTAPVSFTAICTPATATVSEIGAYDVTLHANAKEWQISYGTQGTTAASGTVVSVSGTDTYTVTGLNPATNYVFFVRHDCEGTFSDWSSSINAKTTVVPDSIPFGTGFEDATDNSKWIIVNGTSTTNKFTFGTDANAVASGSKALYISNSTTGTYGYNSGSSTKTYAYRTIYFGSGVHNVSFRFKCTGGESTWDYASIMLVPASVALIGGSGSSVSGTTWPAYAEIFNPIAGQDYFNLMTGDANGWNTFNGDIDMTGREGTYNFVVMWSNDGSSGENYPIAIDNLAITQVTCNVPSVVSGSTTSTGTTISVGTQTATSWEIAVSTTPIDIFGTVTGDVYQQVTSAPAVLTGLTANTAYYYTARAICGEGDTSNWAEVQIARTSCEAYETPYNETFEDPGVLNCWTSNGNVAPSRVTNYKFAGTASMKVTDGAAVSPTMNITTLAQSMLNGWAYSTADSTAFSIGIMVDPEDAGTFEVLGSVMIPAKNTWTEFTTYFSDLEEEDYEDFYNAQHFAIVAGGDATVYIDNIYLGAIPECPKPTEVDITNILANTFDMAWIENGTATSWKVRAIPAAAGQAIIDTVVTTNPATISGLNAASAYSIEIQAICSATDSSLVTNCGTIKTTCDVVNAPYEENFELMTVQTIPDCWDNSGSTTTTATGSSPHYVWGVYEKNGNQMIRMYNYFVSSGYTEIKTPVISLAGSANGHTLYFDLCHQASSGDMGLDISVDGGATWTSLGTYAKTGTSTDKDTPMGWVTEEIDLTAYAGQNAIFRFTNNANYDSGSIFIDNVKVQANLACTTPTALALVGDATAHEAQISWTAGGSETEWGVRIQKAGVTTYQTATTNPYTVTGLDAASNYSISVAAICGVGDTSYYSALITVTTACDAIAAPVNETFEEQTANALPMCWDNSQSQTTTASSTPYYVWGVYKANGNNMLRMYNYYVQSGSAVTVSPAYALTGSANGYILKFDYCHTATCGAFTIEVSNDNGATWNSIGSYTKNSSSTSYTTPDTWTTVTYPLSSYIGDTIRLRFSTNANYDNGAIFVDNLRLIMARSCADPTGISVDNADTYATVTINDTVSTHTQWQYMYGAAGFDTTGVAPVLVDSLVFTINGLTASTAYDVYVRAYCDASEQSNWLMASFSTTASPASFPYVCMFNDSTENAQWQGTISSSTGNRFTIGSDPAALSPGNTSALYITDANYSGYYYSNSASSSAAAYRLFRFEPSQYQLSFSWKCTGGESSYDYARFYIVPAVDPVYLPSTGSYVASGWPSNMIALDGGNKVNLVSSPEWNNVDVTLDMTNRAGSYYLVFVWSNDGSTGNQYPLAINDIEISELTCMSPANISIPDSTITLTSAVVNYSDMNGGGTDVRWWINTTGNRSDTLQSGVVTASPFTISNLTSATKYFLFMQSECSATDKSPVATARFTGGCDVVTTFPFTEDFESVDFPAPCWNNENYEYGESYGEQVEGLWEHYMPTYSSTYINGNGGVHLIGEYAKALLSTPAIHFEADREYNMSFYMYRSNYSYYTDAVKVYLSDYATSIEGATLLNSTVCYDPSISSSACKQISFDLPAGISGDKHIIFIGEYNYWGYVYLDDIVVDRYATCRDLNGGVTVESTTATTMTVSANKGPNHAGVLFAYAPATSAALADTIGTVYSTTGTAVITGLTAGTSYAVYARGVCSETDSTAWTPSTTGTTMASDCFEPQNVHIVGLVGATEVTIAWGGAPDATGYEYMCVGTSIVDTIANDTVVLTGLAPRTAYNFRVRTFCANDTSAWQSLSFTTTSVPAVLPYNHGFEDAAENNLWVLNDGASQYNQFVIGSDTYNGGGASLYISDNGSSYEYDNAEESTSFATRLFSLTAGQYVYSFDWTGIGENGYDYGRVFLAPSNVTFTPGVIPTSIPGGIALDNNIDLQGITSWETVSGIVTIPTDGNYNLVVMWVNDYGYGSDQPLAIDNVQFFANTCPAPTVNLVSTSETSAQIAVVNTNASMTFAYSVSLGAESEAFLTDTVVGDGNDTITITGLAGSTSYHIYVRALCSATDASMSASLVFRTACGTAALPYSEGFETVPTTYSGPGMIESICWNDLNASVTTGSYPSYKAVTSQKSEGNQSLQFANNHTSGELYVVLPQFNDTVSNCRVTFDCAFENLSNSGDISVGYLTNPSQASSYVNVYTAAAHSAPGTNTMASHVADIAGMPTGSRIAFKYGASPATSSYYWGYLDNVRVFQMVQGPVYNDTVCYNSPYANHGFSVNASDLAVGDNTFTRTKSGSNGTPDTVITANVYMYPRIQTVAYDTLCAGQPLVWGGVTIPNPTTRAYTQTGFVSANGCDSTVTLYLTVVPTYSELNDTMCEGDVYTFNGQQLTVGGDYTSYTVNARGCNDTTVLHLYMVATRDTVVETICQGTTYSWHGQTYGTSGTYSWTGSGQHGCTQVSTLILTVLDGSSSSNVTICQGGSYQFRDTLITTAGTYSRTYYDVTIGCTVTETINVTVDDVLTADIYDFACEGHPYVGYGINGVTVTKDTVISVSTKTAELCDSITNVHLTYVATQYGSETVTINKGETYEWYDNTYSETGKYTEVLQSAEGCDSIVTLHLTVEGGVENVQTVKVDVVPNPVRPGMTAYVYGEFGDVEAVEILNNFGQVIDRFAPSSYPIEVQGLEVAGLYYVRVITREGDIYTEKLLVK